MVLLHILVLLTYQKDLFSTLKTHSFFPGFSDFQPFFNLLQPGVAFLYLLKTSSFLMFSGGTEKGNWAVMG